MNRLAFGAIAGLTATMGMTLAMRKLSSFLPAEESYPLPPSELLQRIDAEADEELHHLETNVAHFGYGALAGAGYGLVSHRIAGSAYGLGVWALSYLGWIPAAGLLHPAIAHPRRRNLLMIAAHIIWGVSLASGYRELERSEEVFRRGEPRDARAREPQ